LVPLVLQRFLLLAVAEQVVQPVAAAGVVVVTYTKQVDFY
jgi:hypothetical protein